MSKQSQARYYETLVANEKKRADNFERLVAGTESRADMAERSQRDLLVEMKKWKARALEAEAALKSLTSQKEPTAAGD
jgi:hypothetical protein